MKRTIRMSFVLVSLIAIAVLAFPNSSAFTQCSLIWQQVDNATPTPRWEHSMAFDSDRGVLVLFGGYTGESDTWEFDSATNTWHLVATIGPSPRGGAAMVYDSVRKVTVLAGGFYGVTKKDVWEWDGTLWTQRTGVAELPEARVAHGMAFDSVRGVTVLYGGVDNTSPNATKTLEYDGVQWSAITSITHPGAQFDPGMAFDVARAVTVLAISDNGGGDIQIYEWNGTNWVPRNFAPPVPTARDFPRLTYDQANGVIVLQGGVIDGLGVGGTWTYNGTSWTGTGAPIICKSRHEIAYDTLQQRVLLYSGLNDCGSNNSVNYGVCQTNPQRDMLAWNGSVWSTISAPLTMAPRHLAGVAYHEPSQRTIVYGGIHLNGCSNYGATNATWAWDGNAWQLLAPANNPDGGRNRTSLVYDSTNGRLILHGGSKNENALSATSETWFFSGTNWTQGPSAPIARFRHAAAYDQARGRMVVFGGSNVNDQNIGDTWEFDGSTWVQVATGGPSPRTNASMTYDVKRGVTVLFGGFGTDELNDTWEWDGSTWQEVDVPLKLRPWPRTAASMVYDPDQGNVLLYGGTGGYGPEQPLNSIWTFNGESWTFLTDDLPPVSRVYTRMAYDTHRQRYVVALGSAFSVGDYHTAQTWEFGFGGGSDINCDGSVNIDDLFAVIAVWGPCAGCPEDIDGDGDVDIDDLFTVIANWG